MTFTRKVRMIWLSCLLACMVGCDQASKHVARTALSDRGSMVIPGGIVELRLAENPGTFLSLGEWLPQPVRFACFTLGVGVGLVLLAGYLTGRALIDTPRFIGLSLVLAGGIGNLLDRALRDGLVTDFAMIHVGPVHTGIFNIADVLIMAGTAMVLYSIGRKHAGQPQEGG